MVAEVFQQIISAQERALVGQFARGIDRLAVVVSDAFAPDSVESFKRKTKRIDLHVAGRAGGVVFVLSELLTEREVAKSLRVGRECPGVGWRRGRGGAENA